MPKYIVHIGPPKTGTTYLQAKINAARDALLERGVLYPPNWWLNKPALTHEQMVQKIASGGDSILDDGFRALNESDVGIVLLSFEGFPTLSIDAMHRFRALLGGAPVEFIYYIRRWCERLPSAWQQLVRGGSTNNLPDFVASIMMNTARSPAINPTRVLDKFVTVFGEDSLRIVSYNNVMDRKQDLFRHFCQHVLGFDFAGEDLPIRKNESLGLHDTEMLRVVNIFEAAEPTKFEGNVVRMFNRYRPTLDLTDVIARMDENAAEMLVNDRAAVFDTLYDELTDRFIERMVDPVPDMGLFRRKARTVHYVKSDYLLHNGTADAIRELQRCIRASGHVRAVM